MSMTASEVHSRPQMGQLKVSLGRMSLRLVIYSITFGSVASSASYSSGVSQVTLAV